MITISMTTWDVVRGRGAAESIAQYVVLFLTDNGPSRVANAGLRDRKVVYEGGIRVPFFMRWPGRFRRD
jgi:arylsulfatase A-like enzyme